MNATEQLNFDFQTQQEETKPNTLGLNIELRHTPDKVISSIRQSFTEVLNEVLKGQPNQDENDNYVMPGFEEDILIPADIASLVIDRVNDRIELLNAHAEIKGNQVNVVHGLGLSARQEQGYDDYRNAS